MPANPSIAGQPAEYITLQLAHFKSGLRVNPVMQAMAATLQPDEMKALGIYYSQQKPNGLAAKDATLVTAGQKLFRGGDSCRRASPPAPPVTRRTAPGVAKNYPRLAGPVRGLHVRAAQGLQGRRARRRQGRQGRQRHDHGHGRRQDDGRADESRRRIRVRTALGRRRRAARHVGSRIESQREPPRPDAAPPHFRPQRLSGQELRRHRPGRRSASAAARPCRERRPSGTRRRSRMDDRRPRRDLRHAARISPRSRLIGTSVESGALVLTCRRARRRLRCRSSNAAAPRARSWSGEAAFAPIDAGDEAAAWLSSALGADVRLVRFDPSDRAPVQSGFRRRLGRAHGVRRRLSVARHRGILARRPQCAARGRRHAGIADEPIPSEPRAGGIGPLRTRITSIRLPSTASRSSSSSRARAARSRPPTRIPDRLARNRWRRSRASA